MAPPNVETMVTLKVDNVPFQVAPEELKELFSKYGEVGDVYIPRSRGSNESRGFAFIRYVNKEDAESAITGMEGHDYQGRQLHVQYAKQRRPENPREFYRERDRSGDRGRGFEDRGPRGYDDRGRGYEDRGRGYDDRGRFDDRRRDDRYRYDDRPRRRSRSADRRDYRSGGYGGGGRDRSRSRHSRSPRREPRDHRSASPPRRD